MNNGYRVLYDVLHLPRRPSGIFLLPNDKSSVEIFTSLVSEVNWAGSLVVSGLTAQEAGGILCPVVTLVSRSSERLWGWSLCLDGGKMGLEKPYFFDTFQERTIKGSELPSVSRSFVARIDPSLTSSNAKKKKVDEIIAYALPHIGGNVPPPHPLEQEEYPFKWRIV